MSISEVADRANVSRSTVSLVINNKATISTKTAAAVRRAMEEVGYVPPVRRRGRRAVPVATARIGLIAAMPSAVLRAPVYTDVVHGIERKAREMNSMILLRHADNWAEVDLDKLQENVDGLILFGGSPEQSQLGPLKDLPLVRIMGPLPLAGWSDYVGANQYAIGDLAADYLLKNGHKCAAYLNISDNPAFVMRRMAFIAAFEAAGHSTVLLNALNSFSMGEDSQIVDHTMVGAAIDQLIQVSPLPSCLFIPMDLYAAPTYLSLLERGIKPGVDIQIVSCNNERPLLDGLNPRPVVIDLHAFQVGGVAVERLMWRMKNPDSITVDILIQPTIVSTY